MASGQVVTLSRTGDQLVNGQPGRVQLSDKESIEMQHYEKIIQLRNAILEGNHPKIKLPAHLTEKQQVAAASGQVPSPTLQPLPRPVHHQHQAHPDHRANQRNNLRSFAANSAHVAAPAAPGLGLMAGQARVAEYGAAAQQMASRPPFAKGNTEINPIFLEKSESLIRAEIGLQRQRLERALREECEASGKANNSTADSSFSFEIDIAEVLAKASALVEQQQRQPGGTASATAGQTNNAADDDTSFDENDYYSSRHDTPESRGKAPSSDGEVNVSTANAASKDVPPTQTRPTAPIVPVPPPNVFSIPGLQSTGQYGGAAPNMLQPPFQPHVASAPAPVQPASGSANTSVMEDVMQVDSTSRDGHDTRGNSSQESGEASRSEGGAMQMGQNEGAAGPQFAVVRHGQGQQRASPLVRAHDLSPIAPQPSHVSTLAVAGRDLGGDVDLNMSQGAPAQVAALRNQAPGKSSPDSSSPQAKAAKKKEKRKKRKADKLAQEASTTTPHIKTEPRSPSPFGAAPLPRPSKRQRQAQRQQDAAASEEVPRFEQPAGAGRHRYPLQPQEEVRPPMTYAARERQEDSYYGRPAGGGAPGPPMYEREYISHPSPSQYQYERQAPPQRAYSVQYIGDEYARPVSQSASTRQYREPPQYYPNEYGPAHMGRPEEEPMRSGSPIMMRPPRPPLNRVLVDATGREYFEPQRPQMVRQSVAPSVRPGEPEVIYERSAPVRHSVAPQMRPSEPEIIYERSAPVRSVSKRPGPMYEDGSAVYQEEPSHYGFPRRVVTQPELPPDPRGYGHREYPVRPMAPPADEYQHMDRRPVAEMPREYIARPTSVRPSELVRYEMPREPGNRVHSVRPEPPVREYGTAVHPESRVEMGPPVGQGYGRGPAEPHVVQRSYSVRPPERYYERPGPPMGGDEVAYMGERPHAPPQEVVYVDGPRGDVYR